MSMPTPGPPVPLSPEDQRRVDEHEELLKQNLGPCQYINSVTGAHCMVASISHDDVGADHEWQGEVPASRVLGMPDNDLPSMVVRDDVRFIAPDDTDVTDEVIANNMDAVRVRDLTEE